jgi:hypothetical protein
VAVPVIAYNPTTESLYGLLMPLTYDRLKLHKVVIIERVKIHMQHVAAS